MGFFAYEDGAINLDQVTHTIADEEGGITFHFVDSSTVSIGVLASTKAEALLVIAQMAGAADTEIYDQTP